MADTAPRKTLNAANFVRTPWSVRGHVVAFWQPIPADIWEALADDTECERAAKTERRAVMGTALMATLLLTVYASIGYQETAQDVLVRYPVLGRAYALENQANLGSGWYFDFGQSLWLAAWTTIPPIVGWLLMRLIWIPALAGSPQQRKPRLTFARHLSAVYFYVYLAVVCGATLLPILIAISPQGNGWFRWWLWCFLFGESFFVPALMWIRLVMHDTNGLVFGRYRFGGLTVYLMTCVGVPLAAMISRL